MAQSAGNHDNPVSDEAMWLLEMRRLMFRSFAKELSEACPEPMPRWAQLLLARWTFEALR